MKPDEKACPNCAETIKRSARGCRYCGYQMTADDDAAEAARTKEKIKNGAIGCGGLLVLTGLIAMCSGGSSQPAGDPKEALIDAYRTMLAQAKPCDAASAKAAEAADAASQNSDTVAWYSAASAAYEVCQQAGYELGKIEAPTGLPGDATPKTAKAIEACQNAYYARAAGYQTMMKAIDGEVRPSVVAELKQQMKSSEAGTMVCLLGFMGAAEDAGIDINKLTGTEPEQEPVAKASPA